MHTRIVRLSPVAIFLLLVSGCSNPERVEAVPSNLTTKASVLDIPDVRFFGDDEPDELIRIATTAFHREKAELTRSGYKDKVLPEVNILAISGGGDNGAFGAGLLVGWSKAGDRPKFNVVTGVSTGALTAPFAFLGPDRDADLQKIYTSISADDIFEERGIFAALYDDAMADNAPLWRLVKKYVTEDMLRDIAAEYEKGRLLLVGTTNLDARRPVVWNMGAIAADGSPAALELFRSILVASAAIPGAFPPVMLDVQVDGKHYQEMHVDGGAMAQVILYPASLQVGKETKARGIKRKGRKLYLIRNARLDPDWASVERNTLTIVGRAIASLIQTQGVGDLYQIYLITQRDRIEFNLAHIPETFLAEHKKEFDTEYMQQLFDIAYDVAQDGYPWKETPPGFEGSGN